MENRDDIRLLELTKLDAHELQQELGETAGLDYETLTADRAGEPATFIAVVGLSALAIKGISMWLLKRRTKEEVEFSFERKHQDGSTERRTARVVFSSSSPPPAEVIEQVGAVLNAEDILIQEAKNLVTN